MNRVRKVCPPVRWFGHRAGAACLLLLAGLLAGCPQAPQAPTGQGPADAPWFEDVTQARGLSFVHDAGPTGPYFLPQIIGSGAALFDYDQDGRLDLYLLQNAGPDSTSRNCLLHQEKNGSFRDVSARSGLDIAGHNMGVAVGDVNNDGWPDVLVIRYRGVRLFLNHRGDGTFTDVTKDAGLDGSPLWGTAAAFFDYDGDGWLDLVVVHYVDYDPSRHCTGGAGRPDFCFPGKFGGSVANLYHNLGRQGGGTTDKVVFRDVTLASGLARYPGRGLGVAVADFNGDDRLDLFIANDAEANRLWINRGDGTFAEEGLLRGLAYNVLGKPQGNMGVALGDVDGDGLFDLFVTHLTEETHTLWKQKPRGYFRDGTGKAGLARPLWPGTGFGTFLADFNLDGTLDLAIVNGRVSAHVPAPQDAPVPPFWKPYVERNQLFANDGTGSFHDVSPANHAFCGTPGVSRGLACGDLDNDGAPDLLVTTIAGPARLFRNTAGGRGNWLTVRALDPELHRDAYGAVVTVEADGKRWSRLIQPSSSYLCSNDPRAHFGLGKAEKIDAITVRWPGGKTETFRGGPAGRSITCKKGRGPNTEP